MTLDIEVFAGPLFLHFPEIFSWSWILCLNIAVDILSLMNACPTFLAGIIFLPVSGSVLLHESSPPILALTSKPKILELISIPGVNFLEYVAEKVKLSSLALSETLLSKIPTCLYWL